MTATQALGWALVHSLWQCALAAAGLASLLGTLPSRAARIRYACATATLVLTVALPLVTALSLYGASPWPAPTLAARARPWRGGCGVAAAGQSAITHLAAQPERASARTTRCPPM